MVALRVRFKYIYQLEFEILGRFSVCYSFNILLKKTDLSVPMTNILIRTVKTIIYLNEVFVFQELNAIFPKINVL